MAKEEVMQRPCIHFKITKVYNVLIDDKVNDVEVGKKTIKVVGMDETIHLQNYQTTIIL